MKRCENCTNEAIKKERYCKECKKQVLSKLTEEGYLKPAPRHGNSRSADQKENTRETRKGYDR